MHAPLARARLDARQALPRSRARVAAPVAASGAAQHTDSAHAQTARAYTRPRIAEALRPRPLWHDPLLLAMLPPATCPEVAQAVQLSSAALRATAAAVAAGEELPAEPGRTLRPGTGVPLALRGNLVDRFFDDELLHTVHSLRRHMARAKGPPAADGARAPIQIVDLGCGLGTRPWRLPLGPDCAWFDVDLPAVMEEKGGLLEAAGAQTQLPPPSSNLADDTASNGSNSAVRPPSGARFPLQVHAYEPVACDLTEAGSLQAALEAHGWRRDAPTIWLAYALIYYMDEQSADSLMRAVAEASAAAPAAAFAGTIMNAAMVEMIQESAAAAAAARPQQPSPAGAVACQEPKASLSMGASDAMRRSAAVQSSAPMMRFGVKCGVAAYLRSYGWETAEEVTAADAERMYGVLGVSMAQRRDLRDRATAKHGGPPQCSVGLARRGF